jgi:hypothetical protein
MMGDRNLDLEMRHRDALAAFEAATADALTKFLGPFADTFSALHAVEFEEIPTTEGVPELDRVDADVRDVAAHAVAELSVTGAAGVFRAAVALGMRNPELVTAVVRVVPTDASRAVVASAATRGVKHVQVAIPVAREQGRVLFRQASRNLTKNKGPLMAVGIAALVVTLGWAVWADRRALEAEAEGQRRRQALKADAERRAELSAQHDRELLVFVTERTDEATLVLSRLTEIGSTWLPSLRELADANGDYTTYGPGDRRVVAELAGLAVAAAAVIASQNREPAPTQELLAADGAVQAAQDVVERFSRRRVPSPTPASAVAWFAAGRDTTQQANQMLLLLEQPAHLEKLANTYGTAHQGVMNGFHLEWAHSLSFNMHALAADSDKRLLLTESLGRPHDAADLEVVTLGRRVIRQVQAKAVESNSQRVGPKNGLTDPKYSGMDLLLPADHMERTHEFLDTVLNRPEESLKTAAYRDAKERITDSISVGDISSDPITTAELTAITQDPEGHIQRMLAGTRREQARHAGFAAGGTATVMSLASDTSTYLINEGHLDGYDWTQATIVAARTGVASAVAASAGNYLQSGAQLAVADGSTSWLQGSIANGDHGAALTQAVVGIAAIAHGLATKQLTPEEAAKAAVENITESTLVWGCTALARQVVPNEEVAALVGGLVGQISTQVLLQGLRIALLGRDTSREWDAAYSALLAETAALEDAYEAERRELAALTEKHRTRFSDGVLPALDQLNRVTDCDVQKPDALGALAVVANHFGCAPLFDDLDAFEAFMANPDTALALHLGRRR